MSKPALWATSTAPRENSRNAGSTESILGASYTIAVVIPVSATICGGMLRPGIDQCGELAEHLAAAHLDRADLGDRVVVLAAGAPAGGLQVDDDERGLPQRQVSRQRIDVREAQLAHALTVGNRTDNDVGRPALPRRTELACRCPPIPCGQHRAEDSGHDTDDRRPDTGTVKIDCDDCAVRGPGCQDCVVSVLLGVPETLLDDERRRWRCSPTSGWRRGFGSCRSTATAIPGLLRRHATDSAADYSSEAAVKFASSVGQGRCRFVTYLRPKRSSTRLRHGNCKDANLEVRPHAPDHTRFKRPAIGAIAGSDGSRQGFSPASVQADPADDALAKLNELSRQAEQTTEAMHSAQLDLNNKLAAQEAAEEKHAVDAAAVDSAKSQLATFQSSVDKFAAAQYMGGRTDGLDAMLTAASPQGLIDQLAVQRVMAAEMSAQMKSYREISEQAALAEQASAQVGRRSQDRRRAGRRGARRPAVQAEQAAGADRGGQVAVPGADSRTSVRPWRAMPPAARSAAPARCTRAAPRRSAGALPARSAARRHCSAADLASAGRHAPPPVADTGATVIQAALSRIGSPYSWGGSGPSAFDCSGLVMWSFQQAGISLPHSSQALANGRAAGVDGPDAAGRCGHLLLRRVACRHLHRRRHDGARVDLRHAGASRPGGQCADP